MLRKLLDLYSLLINIISSFVKHNLKEVWNRDVPDQKNYTLPGPEPGPKKKLPGPTLESEAI
jgi:hypothetical protein